MNTITFPLRSRMKRPTVADLQDGLKLLLERGSVLASNEANKRKLSKSLNVERRTQFYGSTTGQLVRHFQEEQSLDVTGEVDEPTATALNRLLEDRGQTDEEEEVKFIVSGQVAEPDGSGIAELVIRAYDKCLGKENELGTSRTDANGRYLLIYQAEKLLNPTRKQADLVVRVFSRAEGLESESPLIINALPQEVVNFVIGEEAYRGPDLYTQTHERLTEYLEGISLDEIELRDLYCLANSTQMDVEQIHHYVRARQWEQEWESLPAEIYFAWFRGGLPTKWGNVLSRNLDELSNSIEQAVEDNLVSRTTLRQLGKLEAKLIERRTQYVITPDDRSVSQGSLGQLLQATALNATQSRDLLQQWQTFEGDTSEFWTAQHERLGERVSQDLDLTLQLGTLTRNHVPLIEALKKQSRVRTFSDVARFTQDEWLQLFSEADLEMPADLLGDDKASQQRSYAEALTHLTELLLPTRVLAEGFRRDTSFDSQQFDRFFDKHQSFEFRHQSVRSYLTEHPDALADFSDPPAVQLELEALQRIFHLSPAKNRQAVAKVLWSNQLHSAWAITLEGEEALLDLFPGEPMMAKRVYTQAKSIQLVSQAALFQHVDLRFEFSPGVLPTRRPSEGHPDLEGLFGGQGYCECKHCLSFFSPSAYLVDLFLYLKKAKLTTSGAPTDENTVLERLFKRRPDLGNLALNCDNAITPIPYIDLVNEVLENAIDPRNYTPTPTNIGNQTFTFPVATLTDPVPQTEADGDVLKAFPQHLNPSAYQALYRGEEKQGIYFPWNLPFNLWAEEVRVYLNHLEVPRWQLMESILSQASQESDVACEYLGLLPGEKAILVDASPTAGKLDQYWGITAALNTFQKVGGVESFLKQSGFSYTQLKELLDLRYVQSANSTPIQVTFDPISSCQVADAKLDNLNNTAITRIHRLGRLERKIGETLLQLDQSVMALEGEINEAFLEDYADVQRIQKILPRKVNTPEILSWWSLLETHDYPKQDSLYRSLFLNAAISQPVEALFELDDIQNELKDAATNQATPMDLANQDLDPDLTAHLLAALQWTMSQLMAVVRDQWENLSFDLNLANLSYLYRVSSFCRALRLQIPEYLALKAVLGSAPLPGPSEIETLRPQATRAFIQVQQLIKDVGLDPEIFNYLLRHQYHPEASFALGTDEIELILLNLQVELNKLLNESDPEGISIAERTQIKLSRVLQPEDVTTFQEILEKDSGIPLTAEEQQAQEDFVDEKLKFFPDPVDAKAKLIGNVLPNNDARYAYVLERLEPYLIENAVVQQLAESLGLAMALAESLLRWYLRNPSKPTLPAIGLFFGVDFLRPPASLDPQENNALAAENFPEQVNIIIRLQKISLLISKLAFDSEAIDFIMTQGNGAGLPDLSQLPVAPISNAFPIAEFATWQLLSELVRINHTFFRNSMSVFDLLRRTHNSQSELLEQVSHATNWSANDLLYLTGSGVLNLAFPADYQSGDWLVKLAEIMPLVTRIGASAQKMADWTALEVTSAQAQSVRLAVKAKYGNEHWLEVTAPLRDQIREQQRDALLSFVLHHERKHDQGRFTDVDDLYGYYLIDPQMSSCTMTSRTVLANSSVQLLVQRILMNLDDPDMEFSRKHAEEWKWRKYYRVWEANRKVLLWPENWIEPELRDDKSPFFQELENELLQDELNEETVERVFVNYLHKLDEVARLEICAVHYEDENHTLHVFGRTAGIPSIYYYRRWENRRNWTAWEKVELDIYNAEGVEKPQTGVLLLPVIHNRRLFLFWPIFTLKKDELSEVDRSDIAYEEWVIREHEIVSEEDTNLELKPEIKQAEENIRLIQERKFYYEVKIAWSQLQQGHWNAKKMTNEAVRTPYFEGDFPEKRKEIKRYFFVPVKPTSGELQIWWFYNRARSYWQVNSSFTFDSCKNELRASRTEKASFDKMSKKLPDYIWYMKAKENAWTTYPFRVTNLSNTNVSLLKKGARGHLLTYSLDKGVFQQTTPLFYEDKQRTFLVVPPLPHEPFIRPELLSETLAGKAGFIQNQAFKQVLKPVLESQVTENQIQILGQKSLLSGYFKSNETNQVMIRPAARFAGTAKQNNVQIQAPRQLLNSDIFASSSDIFSPIAASNIILRPSGDYILRTFYHPYVCLFLKQLNRYGIDGLLKPNPNTADGKALNRQATLAHKKALDFDKEYDPNWNEVNRFDYPQEIITFNYDDAYASYNWELFFHIPLLIATRLYQDQRFEVAQKWFHYIFNPTETEGEKPYRFWKIKPFHTYTKAQMEVDSEALLQGKEKSLIQAWEKDPFNPHLLARFRRLAYMKTTVMKYLDNLIAWGDQLFRRDSIESLNEATQLYVLAGQILGKLPVATEGKNPQVETFNELAEHLNSLGNAWVEIEMRQEGVLNDDSSANDFRKESPDLIPYFCFPPNEKILAYWDTVADRLFKIRHCMNIEGLVRQLPLFQPPIDPALLVRAAASGMDLSSALNDLYAPLPHYRFTVMIQKAQEICQDLKSLGGALLSALEKKDGEALALIRTQQETVLLKANQEIKSNQIEEVKYNLEGLHEQQELSKIRLENYQDREFINAGEGTAIDLSHVASSSQTQAGFLANEARDARRVPDITLSTHTQGISSGASVAISTGIGGNTLGSMIDSDSKSAEIRAMQSKEDANIASTYAQYERRQEDWDLQIDLAKQEIKQIEKQILSSEIRIAIAEKDKENLELQISQSQTVADFLKHKYTDQQLYGWMVGQLSSVYFQTYQLAFDIAKQAEKTFRYELGIEKTSYIQFGYWDNLRKGLLSGEKLSLDIKRLAMAYLEKNKRDYEITKHISLFQLNPEAILRLKERGVCEFELPELLFDLDFPGQYFRRIKSVSITIPCVLGPYTSVSAKLTLLKNRVRKNGNSQTAYAYQGIEDTNFIHNLVGIQSIATGQAQQGSGLFELNFRDERYLPFEGAGAISMWRLELPTEFHQFDYQSISDAILHMNYTAREGGDALKGTVNGHVSDTMNKWLNELAEEGSGLIRLISMKQEFPSEWHRFFQPHAIGEEAELNLHQIAFEIAEQHFPFFLRKRELSAVEVKLMLKLRNEEDDALAIGLPLELFQGEGASAVGIDPLTTSGLQTGLANLPSLTFQTTDNPLGWWKVQIDNSTIPTSLKIDQPDNSTAPAALDKKKIEDLYLIFNYTVEN